MTGLGDAGRMRNVIMLIDGLPDTGLFRVDRSQQPEFT